MSGLPEGYSIRPATMDDVDAVADVLAADDIGDTGRVFFDADFVRFQWTMPGIDLRTDAWVVVSGDARVIGHANVSPEDEDVLRGWGVVHPEHRGLGVGTVLFDLFERRGAERLSAGGRLQHSVSDTDGAAARIVMGRGYRRVRSFRHMEVELDGPTVAPEPPHAVEIRGIDPERDLPTIHAIFVEAFRDEWGYRVIPFEEWLEVDVQDPSYDPSLWLLATEGADAVGALSAVTWGDRGWIAELGVRPPWRGRGIGSALLRRAFGTFVERGLPRVMLNVDSENPTGAIGVYERVGMRAVRGWDVYEKSLPEACASLGLVEPHGG